MSYTVEQKVIIVTGAAQGLGAAIALGLSQAGARVAISDVKVEGLERTKEQIKARSGDDNVLLARCDISNDRQVADLVDQTVAKFGHVDALINNAGLGCGAVRPDFLSNPVPIWRLDPGEWRRVLEINAVGTFLTTRFAVPHMVRRGTGRVVNVTTTFHTMLANHFGAYGPSKAAIEAMSSILVNELSGTGVTVNVVIPGGPADTEQIPNGMVPDREKLLKPSVMVPAIRFLCSDDASDVNGLRFAAAEWDDALPKALAIEKATRPIAWRQLVEPLILPNGVPRV